jgi:CheY-like chemotaxis protein
LFTEFIMEAISLPADALHPPPRRHVLLAEDDRVHAHVATWILRQLECRVHVVPNGAAAVTMAMCDTFDLIFMDWRMPVMDGVEATRSIRAFEAARSRPRTSIVAMTASVMPAEVQQCLDAGMDDVLPKPIVFEELARKVSTWARKRPPFAAAPRPIALFDGPDRSARAPSPRSMIVAT